MPLEYLCHLPDLVTLKAIKEYFFMINYKPIDHKTVILIENITINARKWLFFPHNVLYYAITAHKNHSFIELVKVR